MTVNTRVISIPVDDGIRKVMHNPAIHRVNHCVVCRVLPVGKTWEERVYVSPKPV